MNISFPRQTALVTGASSGIGYELAKILAQHHYDLVLVARRQIPLGQIAQDLAQTYGISALAIAQDLALPEAPQQLYQTLEQKQIAIDALVNNAGFATYGPFRETDLKAELQMMQLNMVALTHLTKLFLPAMLTRGQGKILNVASTAAFQPGPLMAVYYATKAYVLSFSEAITHELQGTGVTVTTLCPGPTASNFQAKAAMEQSKLVKNQPLMDAKTVAQIGYQGWMKQQAIVIPGFKNQFLAFSIRFLPRKLVTMIVQNLQQTEEPR